MDTTKANILLIAPQLSTLDDAIFTLILSDVSKEVTSSAYGANEETAQRYLAAHYLTIINDSVGAGSGSTGFLSSIQTGDVSNDFDSSAFSSLKDFCRYDATAYGRVFMGIKKRSIITAQVFTV